MNRWHGSEILKLPCRSLLSLSLRVVIAANYDPSHTIGTTNTMPVHRLQERFSVRLPQDNSNVPHCSGDKRALDSGPSAVHLAHSGVTNLRLATQDQPPTFKLVAADRAITIYRMFAVTMRW